MHQSLALYAVCPPGLEAVCAAELAGFGLTAITNDEGGVHCHGSLRLLLRANLGLRCGSRVLLRLARFTVLHLDQLARPIAKIPWAAYIPNPLAFSVHVTCKSSRVHHSAAAAQRIAIAIREVLQKNNGKQHVADMEAVAQTVFVRIHNNKVTVSIDSSGEHLHRRGYRLESAKAPLRENVAAGVLLMMGYRGAEALLDPMCGSGTFPIEAALIARRHAPGLLPTEAGQQRRFPMEAWPCFPSKLAKQERGRARAYVSALQHPKILGFDNHPGAIGSAGRNAVRAGVAEALQLERHALGHWPELPSTGLLVVNPPYGERLGAGEDLRALYAALGEAVRTKAPGWRVAVITPDERLAQATGLSFAYTSAPIAHGGLRVRVFATTAPV